MPQNNVFDDRDETVMVARLAEYAQFFRFRNSRRAVVVIDRKALRFRSVKSSERALAPAISRRKPRLKRAVADNLIKFVIELAATKRFRQSHQ